MSIAPAAEARTGDVRVDLRGKTVEETHLMVDTPLAAWERILRVNLTGTFLCTRAAARATIARRRSCQRSPKRIRSTRSVRTI